MLYDKLKGYSKSGVYPFHMPGHKRRFYNEKLPFELDITEIDGFDNLQNPTGCIKAIEERAARLYDVKKAFISVNGSTGGVLAAIRSMTKRGDRVLVARNCHASVYHAIELFGLKPEFILPEYYEKCDIYAWVCAKQIEKKLEEHGDISLVIITSPTYEGVCSDVKAIAEVCHNHGAKLFVDEAHGAHFPFSKSFPQEAVKAGADSAVVSLQKTLPSMTQTALLLTDSEELSQILKSNLSFFQSSSPSYVLMASVEICLDYIEKNKSDFELYTENLNRFYKASQRLENLRLLKKADFEFGFDIGKLVIVTNNTDLSGVELAKILREKYKIETEMSSLNYVIAMTSVCDTKSSIERLLEALIEIDSNCLVPDEIKPSCHKLQIPDRAFPPCEAENHTEVKTELDRAENKAAMEYIWAYPPGSPMIVPGEIISGDLILMIKSMIDAGVSIYSSQNNLNNNLCISVAEFD